MNTVERAIQVFLTNNNYPIFDLKAILFDMDGVLFDSMPNHARAWHAVMKAHDLDLSYEEAFLHEGRTGADTIQIACRKKGIQLSNEEIIKIYKEKTEYFKLLAETKPMSGSYELLKKVINNGLFPMIVTGSGQVSLLDNLQISFPGIFQKKHMVTAFDVQYGKPNPEPYLKALDKGNLKPWEAIVIENAPLGVEAARKAGLFVIVVNTGPLSDKSLWEAGANLLYPSMLVLNEEWEKIMGFSLKI